MFERKVRVSTRPEGAIQVAIFIYFPLGVVNDQNIFQKIAYKSKMRGGDATNIFMFSMYYDEINVVFLP